jgi:DNA-binding winged helix-turn-helix (wHTH) protein/predicted ATPase
MIYRFGSFELDDQLFELRRGGAVVSLQPRVFDLLVFLVEHRDAVVTRAELLEHVWGGVTVTKDALAQAVMALRKSLGDDGETPTYIDTVRGRGYRFVAPVTATDLQAPVSGEMYAGFVGRAEKVAQVVERIGRGGLVLATGDAGVGKTRFLEELAARAGDAKVLRAHASSGAPELWTLTQTLRELRRKGAELRGDLDAVAEGTLDPAKLDDARARFALADAMIDLLGRAPVLVLVDDLHPADARTHALFGVLVPRLRTTSTQVCVSYTQATTYARSFQALLGMASRDPSTAVIRLDPFTRAEVAAYLEATHGVAPTDALLDKIHEKTRGNAVLLAQVASMRSSPEWLRESNVKTGSLVGVDTLREAIGHQLRTLPADVVRVLSMAAVFGRTFSVAPLSAALGAPNADVLSSLDAACVARVVVATDSGSYRFAYPLVRDVIHGQLTATERAHMHGLAAKALEEHLAGGDDHPRVGEIARHLAEAAATGDVDHAVEWAIRAADLAEAAGDGASASSYAERGLAALAYAQKPDPAKRARLTAKLTPRR